MVERERLEGGDAPYNEIPDFLRRQPPEPKDTGPGRASSAVSADDDGRQATGPVALVRERLDDDDTAEPVAPAAELPPMRPRLGRKPIQAEPNPTSAVITPTEPNPAVFNTAVTEAESAAELMRGDSPSQQQTDDPVNLGREAWLRIKNAAGKAWADWKLIGEALMVGRRELMAKAGTNKPSGKKYSVAFHHWCHDHDFGDFDKDDRAKLLLIMENLSAVEAHRASMSEADRLRWNHPTAVWRAWKCPDRGGRFREQQGKAAPVGTATVTGVDTATVTGVDTGVDEFDEEQEEIVWQRGLYWRAHRSAAEAELKTLWALPEPPSDETIAEVRKATEAWATTLRYVETLPNTTAEERAEARRSHALNQANQAAKRKAKAEKAQAKKLNGEGEHLERERLDE